MPLAIVVTVVTVVTECRSCCAAEGNVFLALSPPPDGAVVTVVPALSSCGVTTVTTALLQVVPRACGRFCTCLKGLARLSPPSPPSPHSRSAVPNARAKIADQSVMTRPRATSMKGGTAVVFRVQARAASKYDDALFPGPPSAAD